MQDPGRAHHFRFALDDGSPAARRLERAVAWRCRTFGLPYGDQGLLIQRDLLDSIGVPATAGAQYFTNGANTRSKAGKVLEVEAAGVWVEIA
jgi:hypothetical protein